MFFSLIILTFFFTFNYCIVDARHIWVTAGGTFILLHYYATLRRCQSRFFNTHYDKLYLNKKSLLLHIYINYSKLSNPQLYGIPVCRKRIELTLRGFRRLQLCILGKNYVNYEDGLVKLRLQSLDKRREAMSLICKTIFNNWKDERDLSEES